MEKRKLTAIILAAGRGTRMNSPLPKVLHPVAGRPIIEKIIKACKKAGVTDVRLVVGYGQNLVRLVVEPLGVQCFEQVQQTGTASAVRAALPEQITDDVIILNGDHPLLNDQDLSAMIREFRDTKSRFSLVTAVLKDPKEFGRVVRHFDSIKAIVETREASRDTLQIKEINTGIYILDSEVLNEYLPRIQNQNSKKEFYLTDLVSLCLEDQIKVHGIKASKRAAFGVNNQVELAQASRFLFRKKARELLDAGVVMIDPTATYIEDNVTIGPGTVIYPNVFIKGPTTIGSYCVLEPNCYLIDATIEDSVQVRGGSYIESAKISKKAIVGPYARLRPGTEIGEEAQVGNFVEFKKVKFGKKSKAAHLTYMGDAEVGEDSNIGCGTITCNYTPDKKKHKTRIGSRVFVGSDTSLVAPIDVGDDSVVASGSTLTDSVPSGALAIARGKQVNKEGYAKKYKQTDLEND